MSSQKFSCINCGHMFEIFPPQTGYNMMRLERCKGESEDHNIPMRVECENCHKNSDVFWCTGWHGTSKII